MGGVLQVINRWVSNQAETYDEKGVKIKTKKRRGGEGRTNPQAEKRLPRQKRGSLR